MTAAADAARTVAEVDDLDCAVVERRWPFADEHAAAIDQHWAEATAIRPQLFNGRVLMLTEGGIVAEADRRVFRGCYAAVDFKAFLAWRDFGHPGQGFRNGFGMAALQAADGAFVLGEMAAHTANAGRIYFPSGTPDPGDIAGGAVDIGGSIRRELAEETGLDPDDLAFEPGYTIIADPLRVAVFQRVRCPMPADRLVARIHAALAREKLPELTRMHIVRGIADISPAMPPFVALYLRRAFAAAVQPG